MCLPYFKLFWGHIIADVFCLLEQNIMTYCLYPVYILHCLLHYSYCSSVVSLCMDVLLKWGVVSKVNVIMTFKGLVHILVHFHPLSSDFVKWVVYALHDLLYTRNVPIDFRSQHHTPTSQCVFLFCWWFIHSHIIMGTSNVPIKRLQYCELRI